MLRPECPDGRLANPDAPGLEQVVGQLGIDPIGPVEAVPGRPAVFAVARVVTAALHSSTPDRPADAERTTGRSKTRRLQDAFATHLPPVARGCLAVRRKRVVLTTDDDPRDRETAVDAARGGHPHPGFDRLPADRPSRHPVERFWRVLRRRAGVTRLFDTPADPKRSIRNRRCDVPIGWKRMRSLVAGCCPARNATASPNS